MCVEITWRGSMRAQPVGQVGMGTSAGGGNSWAFHRPLPSSPFTFCLLSSSLLISLTPLSWGLAWQCLPQYDTNLPRHRLSYLSRCFERIWIMRCMEIRMAAMGKMNFRCQIAS